MHDVEPFDKAPNAALPIFALEAESFRDLSQREKVFGHPTSPLEARLDGKRSTLQTPRRVANRACGDRRRERQHSRPELLGLVRGK